VDRKEDKQASLEREGITVTYQMYHGGGLGSRFPPKRRKMTLMRGAKMFAISTVGLRLPIAKPIPIWIRE
jgi:hypothetical protein